MDAEQQFQTAANLHQSGDLVGAEKILTELASTVPNHPDILHFLSIIQMQNGKPDAAVDTLKELTELKSDWPEGFDLFGCALKQSGRLEAAIRQFKKAIKLAPDFAQAYYNMGNCYRDNRQFDEAARQFNKTILINPNHMDARFNLGQALFNLGKLVEAVAAFQSVVDHQPSDSEAGLALAHTLVKLGNPVAARDALENTISAAPKSLEAQEMLAELCLQLNDFERAIKCFDYLLADNPKSNEYLRGKAAGLRGTGNADAAVEICRQALIYDPENSETLYYLAHLLERMNKLDEARKISEQGLSLEDGHIGISVVAARLDRRAGDIEKGIARLSAIPDEDLEHSPLASEIHFEFGQLYERLDRPGDAIENFVLGNARMIEEPEKFSAMKDRSRTYLNRVREAFEARRNDSEKTIISDASKPSPVFVVGFPRSGTTLLDQVLDAHPNLQVLEEEPTISVVRDHLLRHTDGFPASLFDIPNNVLDEMRSLYFQTVDNCVQRQPSTTLIDKLPLNIIDAGLIHRLFPSAKFIMALRHPCDVCLSCFMQPFDLNDAMAHFTNLDDTVAFYDAVLDLWQVQRQALNLSVHDVRYEDLVTGLEPVARELLTFLDISWDDAVLDPTAHAQSQKYIGTSSYHQVVEKINTRAVDRWRKYEIHLTPYLKCLRPHIEALGYTETP